MSLDLVFMGTPDFAVPALQAVLSAGHHVVAVYSQPPREAGRGLTERPSPVARLALERGLALRTPASLKGQEEQESFAALPVDAAVVVAYGLLLPRAVLAAPRLGCFNLHASLLPRWRGAAPIQRAVMAGDEESGVTVMRMEEGLDTGPICGERRCPIPPGTTAGELHDALARLGADLLTEALGQLEAGTLACRPQPAEGVTYAAKIDKGETHLDFSRPVPEVLNRIHGLSPAPGAWMLMPHEGRRVRVKILKAAPAEGCGRPGEIVDDRLAIACGAGAIRPVRLQREGRAAMSLGEFLRGTRLAPGTVLA